jgi:hypothetical protein
MADFKSQFILDQLGDYWRRFQEIEALQGLWDGMIELAANLRLNADQINKDKGLFTVSVQHRSSPVMFVFDDSTLTTVPAGYAASYEIDGDIESIPQLSTISDGTGTVLFEGVNYVITSPGVISFTAVPPTPMFAQDVFTNRETVYRNFGYPIGFKEPNSEVYLQRVQGLWYALWNGAAVGNIKLAMHILFGLPFIQMGTVASITPNLDGTTTVVVGDQTFILPAYLTPVVNVGDVITNFTEISDGVEIFDFINNPAFFQLVGLPAPQKYFTFFPVVLADVVIAQELAGGVLYDPTFLKTFLDKIKPAYTNYIIAIDLKMPETMYVWTDPTILQEIINLTSTVNFNYVNYFILGTDFETLNGVTLVNYNAHLSPFPNFDPDGEEIGFDEHLTVKDLLTLNPLVTV